jgi:hypothetical protein
MFGSPSEFQLIEEVSKCFKEVIDEYYKEVKKISTVE